MAKAILILGSNEGERLENLLHAKEEIIKNTGPIIKESSIYTTASWGKENLPDHLNQTIIVDTNCSPIELLDKLLSIELEMGRVRKEKWGMRIIDLDILFFDNLNISIDRLNIPHPAIPLRRFTLIPLVEMIPEFIHPTLHKNMRQLLEDCTDSLSAKIYL